MQYFSKDFADFFTELEKNNHKDWFHTNKKRYEKSVKEPFKVFVEDLIAELQKIHPEINMTARDSIMRINRDIRFSADKTPYKTHMAAFISPHGKKDKSRPGFMMQANHNDIRVYSGAHSLEKDQLLAIRRQIAKDPKGFQKLLDEPQFAKAYGQVLGEKNKRLDSEFKDIAETQPLIANKSFYYFFKLKPSILTTDDLIPSLISNYQIALPVNAFFDKALA